MVVSSFGGHSDGNLSFKSMGRQIFLTTSRPNELPNTVANWCLPLGLTWPNARLPFWLTWVRVKSSGG